MIVRKFVLAPLAAVFLVGAGQASAAADPEAVQRIRADVEFLASDLLEGRDTGSRGYDIAAAYVASRFKAIGLKPGGENGTWYQQVPFRRAAHAGVPQLSITRGGKTSALKHGQDLAVRPSLTEKERSIDAPLVFVGHGISDPTLGIDEYAGLDVRGKIVVALRGTPAGTPSDVGAHLESAKDDVAAAKGAIGYAELSFPGPGNPAAAGADRPLLDWADSAGGAGSAGLLRAMIVLSPELSGSLFEGAPMTLKAAGEAARAPIRGFDLPVRLRIQANSTWDDFTSPQVVGLVPGADPALAREHVMLMAHLDHLGVVPGAKAGEDSVFNGALDNATGIATMLEAARAFTASEKRPRRSVLFVAVNGEEKGLRGADYFAAKPPLPIEQIVALVNLDMPLLLYPFRDVIAFGAEHSTVARAVAEAGKSMGVATAADPMPEQGLFVRSDHYRFVTRGVPSVFLMTGHANGGEAAWKGFLGGVYHSPKDEVSQPIDWDAAARFGELNYRIARTLADGPERPMWYKGSYFGDTFGGSQPRARR